MKITFLYIAFDQSLKEKRRFVSIWIPSIVASVMTLLMFIGEMILLHGHLYSFGEGFLFNSIPEIILAPADLLTIVISGGITALIFRWLNRKNHKLFILS